MPNSRNAWEPPQLPVNAIHPLLIPPIPHAPEPGEVLAESAAGPTRDAVTQKVLDHPDFGICHFAADVILAAPRHIDETAGHHGGYRFSLDQMRHCFALLVEAQTFLPERLPLHGRVD